MIADQVTVTVVELAEICDSHKKYKSVCFIRRKFMKDALHSTSVIKTCQPVTLGEVFRPG